MKRNYWIVLLVMMIFFVISFLTNIMGPLIPDIIKDFKVSNGMAALLPFSFFIAYGVMSIPAGILTEKLKEKKIMIIAFLFAVAGAGLFASFPYFGVALISLFLIGIGMAILQVAINPLLRVAGGEEHFAFNSVLAQLFFGGASFVSPWVYMYLVENLKDYQGGGNFVIDTLSGLVPADMSWVSLYWIFALVALVMVVVISFIKLPQVELKEDEKTGGMETVKHLLVDRKVVLFFLGIFAYVGTEQGVANWISEFLKSYHGMDPEVEGAKAVSYFWGLLTIGCFLGLGLLKIMDSKLVLRIFSICAMIALTTALFAGAQVAFYSFIAVGFSASVMWSVIFSLALNSVKSHHGTLAGILCTGIMGGAIVPLIVGGLADVFGLKIGMTFLYVTLGYILSISFWAKPLIKNKTIFDK